MENQWRFGDGVRLMIGAGGESKKNWLRHDRVSREGIDLAFDLNQHPWPIPDNVCLEIEALGVVEQLNSLIEFMDECWRILRREGRLHLVLPDYRSPETWIDPANKRGYHIRSFDYFDPTTDYWKKWGQYYTKFYWHVMISRAEPWGEALYFELTPLKEEPWYVSY